MSAKERSKGQRGEREVVQIFKAAGWTNAERTSRGVSQGGKSDIALGPTGCAIEVKYQEKLSVPKALDQLIADAGPLDMPILVHRPSRHEWMATVRLEDLLPLLALRQLST